MRLGEPEGGYSEIGIAGRVFDMSSYTLNSWHLPRDQYFPTMMAGLVVSGVCIMHSAYLHRMSFPFVRIMSDVSAMAVVCYASLCLVLNISNVAPERAIVLYNVLGDGV